MDENNDLEGMMAQLAQAQGKLAQLQEELNERTVEAQVANGAVKVVATGKLDLKSIKIDPKIVDPKDVGLLEDMVLAAVNRALADAREMAAQAMAQGMFPGGLPGT